MDNWLDRLCAQRNAACTRDDVEWAVSSTGDLYLRDRPEWVARRTAEIAQQQDKERRIWMANYRKRQRGEL